MDQISKNTVSAENQLKVSDYVQLLNGENTGVRVMFLGNSITFHDLKPSIGWHHRWGMAATSQDRDYVHLLMEKIKCVDPNAVFCICQGGYWELNYKKGEGIYSVFEKARDFGADVIVMRLIENCRQNELEGEEFKKALMSFLSYLSGDKKPRVILTTGFWHHKRDVCIRELAVENGLELVELGDLGEDDDMKAIGLFEHDGVANHPGDKGMQAIADRIFECFKSAY